VLIVPIFAEAQAATSMAGLYPVGGAALGPAIKIDTNNLITVVIGSTEMGQGIMTGLAQLVAAELMLDWTQVRAEHSVTTSTNVSSYANPAFGMQLTGGSWSIRGYYLPLRQAAAKARALLIQAAAMVYQQQGGSSTAAWSLLSGGRVSNGSYTFKFSELVATAAALPLQDQNAIVGARAKRLDIPAKVDGSAIFGMDVVLPNMVYATTLHCPTLTGAVKTVPTAPTGITLVNLGTAVGVIGKHTWAVMQAASSVASKITWNLPASTTALDTATLNATGQALVASTSLSSTSTPKLYIEEGDQTTATEQAIAAPTTVARIDATYSLPMLAHGYMEVLNCTVNPVYANGVLTACELWVPTQAQQFVIPAVASLTGLTPTAITVHTPYVGGGFGRKIETDYVAEAVKLAMAAKKPVKLMWTRPQDFANDKYRPSAVIRVRAGVNSSKAMTGLLYRNVSPSINLQRSGNPEDTGGVAGAVGLPYAVPLRRIEYVPNATNIPLGYWRSVGESYNTFAMESAIDELALAAKVDPMAFRLAHLAGDARALGVLNAVKTLSNWGSIAGQGVAFLKGFGSYIAMVAQVSKVVNTKTGAVTMKVNAIQAAIDCGVVVNPDSVEAQIQGGIAMGVGATLWQQATFVAGKPAVNNFNAYRVVKISDMPAVNVQIVSSTQAPGGVGEPGVPCVAPAIANAWARLTGIRLRSLPFYPGSTMGGL
jgi:isoquinoline 1-oxidoreductase beta subunit